MNKFIKNTICIAIASFFMSNAYADIRHAPIISIGAKTDTNKANTESTEKTILNKDKTDKVVEVENVSKKELPPPPKPPKNKRKKGEIIKPLTNETETNAPTFYNGTYIRALPSSTFYVIKDRESKGKLKFADSKGRYLIVDGDLYDLWDSNKKLSDVKSIEYSITHIPTAILKPFNSLNEILLSPLNATNTKGREVYIFADPIDPTSRDLIVSICGAINVSYYNVHIVLIPASEESAIISSKFACSKATVQEKLNAIKNGDFSILDITQVSQCEAVKYTNQNYKLTQTLELRELPMLLAPSGRFASGVISEPFKFIQSK